MLEIYYKDKKEELKVLQEFESNYKLEKAIWWYTEQTFFYRLLNQVFRQRNIELLFLFGFYLNDIHRQLKEEHEKLKLKYLDNPIIKVYPEQRMSNEEFERKKKAKVDRQLTCNAKVFA